MSLIICGGSHGNQSTVDSELPGQYCACLYVPIRLQGCLVMNQ